MFLTILDILMENFNKIWNKFQGRQSKLEKRIQKKEEKKEGGVGERGRDKERGRN